MRRGRETKLGSEKVAKLGSESVAKSGSERVAKSVRNIVVYLICVLWAVPMWGQALSDKFYEENPQGLFDEVFDVTDTLLYYRPRVNQTAFDRFSRYSFSYVSYARRAEHYTTESVRLGSISVQTPLDEWSDYNLIALLRRVPMESGYELYTSEAAHNADLRSEWYNPSPRSVPQGHSLKLQYSERSFRTGVHYAATGRLGQSRWHYSLAAGGRTGGDVHVRGIFINDAYVWLAAERCDTTESIYGDMEHRLLVAFALAPSQKSQRSWNTQEVFDLAANPLYNSYWGYQQGRERASRVREQLIPVLYGSYSLEDEWGIVGANLAAMIRAGRKKSSSLDWGDAMSPMPDYAGYLPSGQDDPHLADETREVWRQGDTNYTQIGWDKLYLVNQLSQQGAVYAILDDVTDIFSAEISLSGGEGGRRKEGRHTVVADGLFGGVNVGYHSQRRYNKLGDLLGGSALGSGFDSYDYTITHLGGEIYQSYYTSGDAGAFAASASLGSASLGYRSATTGTTIPLKYQTAAKVKATWNYRFGPQANISALVYYHLRSPHYSNIYSALDKYTMLNPHAKAENNVGAEVRGNWNVRKLRLSAAAWGAYTEGECRVEALWNDIAGCFSSMMAGGINTLRGGVELDAVWNINNRWSIESALGVGRWRYASDAVGTIAESATGRTIASDTKLYIKGKSASVTPEAVAAVKVLWRPSRAWMMSLEGVVATGRRLAPPLLLTSAYLLERNLTEQEAAALTAEESLGVAPHLSALVYRRIGSWGVSLSVRNLLSSQVKYNGYKPSRVEVVEKEYQTAYAPQASKYQYTYPRTISLTVSYEF